MNTPNCLRLKQAVGFKKCKFAQLALLPTQYSTVDKWLSVNENDLKTREALHCKRYALLIMLHRDRHKTFDRNCEEDVKRKSTLETAQSLDIWGEVINGGPKLSLGGNSC